MSVERVLIGFDFSETSRRAALAGIELAAQLRAEAIVVSVLDVGDLREAMKLPLPHADVDHAAEQVAQFVDQQYDELEKAAGGPFRRLTRRGIPATEIAAAASEERADLIVLGAEGISRRVPLGSCARDVLRHSGVPVMLVPAA